MFCPRLSPSTERCTPKYQTNIQKHNVIKIFLTSKAAMESLQASRPPGTCSLGLHKTWPELRAKTSIQFEVSQALAFCGRFSLKLRSALSPLISIQATRQAGGRHQPITWRDGKVSKEIRFIFHNSDHISNTVYSKNKVGRRVRKDVSNVVIKSVAWTQIWPSSVACE